MICVKCKNNIGPNDEFSKVEDFNHGRYVKTWYIHKVCFFETIKMSQEFKGIANNLSQVVENLLQ